MTFTLAASGGRAAAPAQGGGAGIDGKPLRQHVHRVWHLDDGLPQNTVTALLQTGDGYLWVGTQEGLARFDGAGFRVFTAEGTPGLAGNFVLRLYEDRRGTLWVGTLTGASCYRAGRFTAAAGAADRSPVFAFAEDGGEEVLAGGAAGLRRLHPVDARVGGVQAARPLSGATPGDPPAAALGGARVSCLLAASASGRREEADLKRATWVGTSRGLFRMVGSDLMPVPEPGPVRILSLAESPDGSLWVGTNVAGLWRRDAAGRWTHLSRADGLPAETVFALAAARPGGDSGGSGDGTMRVGTLGGLCTWRQGRVEDAGTPSGSGGTGKNAPASALCVDREGSLWVGTFGDGLHQYVDGAFTTLSVAEGLPDDLVLSVRDDAAGRLWVGTNHGLACFERPVPAATTSAAPGGWAPVPPRVLTTADGLAGDTVWSLWADEGFPGGGPAANAGGRSGGDGGSDGEGNDEERGLWIGTDEGLSCLRADGRLRTYSRRDDEPLGGRLVSALHRDRRGVLWVGSADGPRRFRGGRLEPCTPAEDAPRSNVLCFAEDAAGTLFVGTAREGVRYYRDGRFRPLASATGEPSPLLAEASVRALHWGSDGALWLTLGERGVGRYHDGRLEVLTPREGLPTSNFGAVLEDGARGDLWLPSNRGVCRLRRPELDRWTADPRALPLPVLYTNADGMKNPECNGGSTPAAWVGRDGVLSFATSGGVARVDPAALSPLPAPPPPVRLDEVLADGRPLAARAPAPATALPGGDGTGTSAGGPELRLLAGTRRVELAYAGLSFRTRTRFRYRLLGFDRDWVEAGGRRVALYTNLPPGDYCFEVAARAEDGLWPQAGRAAAFRLRQEPSFWQTGWFAGAIGLAGAGVLAGVFWARQRVVRRRHEAVLAERGRLAREIHDTLAQGLTGIVFQLEAACAVWVAQPAEALAHVRSSIDVARENLGEARRSIGALDASARDEALDLAAELAGDLCRLPESVRGRVCLRVEDTAGEGGGPVLVPALVGHELRRIVGEAVTNALKHAGPDARIFVELKVAAGRSRRRAEGNSAIELWVRDDGRGFAPGGFDHGRSGSDGGGEAAAAMGTCYGLVSMRERATHLGARFELRSQPGAGTVVRVRLDRPRRGKVIAAPAGTVG